MTAKNQDFAPGDLRTPDMAEIEVIASVTFEPDPANLINYLNKKGEPGIREILDDVVEEAVRERAANPTKDPKTWEEAVKMKELFIAEVAATIIGRDVDTIPPDELKTLARQLRRGNGNIKIENLGIILSRVNIKSIKPKGELAQAAEQAAKERRQTEAEKVEIENVADRVQYLVGTTHISPELAVEVVQTERKKVTKDIKEIKINAGSAAEILGKFLSAFRG
jgi:regulator of protease activity HflC (stomatin/prohibitin superfamily)